MGRPTAHGWRSGRRRSIKRRLGHPRPPRFCRNFTGARRHFGHRPRREADRSRGQRYDTIDCVVMGYDKGKGKRTGFGIGAFLVGIYDKKKDMFETVAKIGTGLSDDEWREMHERCSKIISDHKPALYDVDTMMNVDVWVLPNIVVEIKADEITRSSVHTAGRLLKESKSGKAFDVDEPGYALRFPRLTRFRDDKKPEDATTIKEVKELVR